MILNKPSPFDLEKSPVFQLVKELKPLQTQLNTHTLYAKLTNQDAILHFMNHHVFCVWDFMNLLKTLQIAFTSVDVPWQPPSNPHLSRLINEIVLEEESDIIEGQPTSHFMFYVHALRELAGDQHVCEPFLRDLDNHLDYSLLISQPYIPMSVRLFLESTRKSMNESILHTVAAFTFGREALVPDLFQPILANPTFKGNATLQSFASYLSRHIELDGEHHSQLAYQMVDALCHSKQDWDNVRMQATLTLQARLILWDSILASMPH